MSYIFFFSYARSNASPYLTQFFEDLCAAVRERKRWEGDVGFLDQRNLPLGAPWDNDLRQALQTSKVLVSVYASPYFQSDNCGREWQVFQMRSERYVANERAARNQEAAAPPVIKPVIWLPMNEPLPKSVATVQYTSGSADAVHNKIGLQVMTRQSSGRFQSEYIDFIGSFAQSIVDASNYDLPPAELQHYPTFESVPNAFEDPKPEVPEVPAAVAPATLPTPELIVTRPRALGPNWVQFVFVAGSPAEFMKESLIDEASQPYFRRQIESYLDNGGREWKPFYPHFTSKIRPLVTGLASGLELNCEELDFDDHLADNIRDANESKTLVIILADSWTVGLQKYRTILESFDRNLYKNCSVLIPWNDNDPELALLTQEQRAALEKNVTKAFPNWSSVTKPLYFCYSIRSADQLNARLLETLKALRESFINDTMNNPSIEIARPVESAIIKPSITSKPDKDAVSEPSQVAR